ncbi:mini-circle protein [Amycolatopsis antarctica]|uniref:Mini-circle protein n=1 Tax=Amycolatopsis antarctica TaxID=1854586 RepID=A0A263DAV1_9PSEU|nr:DinB family protein [Amycolatopsis antarctica]OZM74505.1 mini-circle protein [Amycolatopsis antarctica]
MTTTPVRTDPPMSAGEREQLTSFLDFLRETVVLKCSGLTDAQARSAHVPSELTTIAGLLGHLTYVERYWFHVVLHGGEDIWKERLAADPDAEFRAAMTTPVTELIAGYQAQCASSRRIAEPLDLAGEVTFCGEGRINLRWVVTHMIEETARHLGHLDLLRELTDGTTGE